MDTGAAHLSLRVKKHLECQKNLKADLSPRRTKNKNFEVNYMSKSYNQKNKSILKANSPGFSKNKKSVVIKG